MIKGATLSNSGIYRYELWRVWDEAIPPVMFIGMNPSTADAEQDDPTIRRCIGFARDWGYGGLLMGNLFALRATNPKDLLKTSHSPVGEMPWSGSMGTTFKGTNDTHLLRMKRRSALILAAWGAIKMPEGWEDRPKRVQRMLGPMHALNLTKDGHPGHPLYVKANTRPIPLPLP